VGRKVVVRITAVVPEEEAQEVAQALRALEAVNAMASALNLLAEKGFNIEVQQVLKAAAGDALFSCKLHLANVIRAAEAFDIKVDWPEGGQL